MAAGNGLIIGFSERLLIAVEIIDRPDLAPLGAGECATDPTFGAIADALAHVPGVRARYMPITAARVKIAIGELPG